MAGRTDGVAVNIGLSTKKALKNVRDLNKEVNSLGKNINTAFQTTAIIGWGKAIMSVTQQMINASKAQSEYIENFNLLEVSYKNNTGSAEKLMDTLKNFYGLNPSGLTKQLATYKQMTSAMQLGEEASSLLSENLLKMQEDVASLYNLDFERVGSKFQSALAGQTRAVRDLGVDITQTSLQQELYNRGIDKSITDMNRASKTVLIYLAMERQLSNAQGDAARTINSVANQTKIFREQISIASRQIGALFIPVLKTVLPILNGILMTLNAIGEFILGLLGLGAKDLASEFGISTISTDFDDLGVSLDDAGKKADKLYGKLRPFDKLNVITTPTDSGSNNAAKFGGGIDKDLLGSLKTYNEELEKAKNKAKEIRDAILGWLGFTVDENGQIKDFHITLGSVAGILMVGGIVWKGLKGIAGIVGNIGKFFGLSSPISKAVTGMKNLFTGGLSATNIGKVTTKFAKLGTVIAGAFFGIDGLQNATKVGKKFADETQDAATKGWELAGSLSEVAIGGALIGANFGPIGAIIGGVTGLVVGATAAWLGYDKALEEMAKKELFGNIEITTQEWADDLAKLNPELNTMYETITKHNQDMEGLANNFTNAYEELDKYSYRFGNLGVQITDEDGPKITSAINETFTNASKIVKEETDFAVDTFTSMWKNGSELSKEEQNNILNNIINYGKDQQKELNDAQDKITKIYNEAIKRRGYLTDEEYKEIKKQLEKIRILTTTQVGDNEAQLIKMQKDYQSGKLQLNEESYKNLAEALKKYNEDVEKKAWTSYQTRLDQIEKYHKLNMISEDEYLKLTQEAYDDYYKDIEEGQKKANEYLGGLLDDLKNAYADSTGKSRELIEGIFKDLNIDTSDMIKQIEDAAGMCYEKFNERMNRGIKKRYDVEINPILNGRYQIGSNNSNYLEIQKKADGGFVDEGQMFLAREAGPEMVGRIGNKTAVANNDQIVSAISIGVERAMSRAKTNSNVVIKADADTEGLLNFINFKQQQMNRQYGF